MRNIYCRIAFGLLAAGLFLLCRSPQPALAWERQHPPLPLERLHDVRACDTGQVYAVGTGGFIYRFDGAAWDIAYRSESVEFKAVWALGSTDVFAVGAGGCVFYYNGLSWNELGGVPGDDLNGIWGDSPSNLFAVGRSGSIYHFDGTGWNQTASETRQSLNGIWGFPGGDVFAVGDSGTACRFDGTTWQDISTGLSVTLRKVWGASPIDLFAVGDGGVILHYDGLAWKQHDSQTDKDLLGLFGVDGMVLAVGEQGTVKAYNGTVWQDGAPLVSDDLTGIHGTSAEAMYISGSQGCLYRYDPAGLVVLNSPLPPRLKAVWGDDERIFAVGESGTILQYTGSDWIDVPGYVTDDLNAVDGIDGAGIFAAGANGTIVEYDGSNWVPMVSPVQKDLLGLWAGPDGEALTAGREGTLLRFDGQTWTAESVPARADLYAVKGEPGGRQVAVGAKGTLIEYDGGSWTQVDTPTTADLTGVWSDGAGRFYASGRNGTILYSDAFEWSALPAPGNIDLYAVWGNNADDVYVAGQNGTILHFNGESWALVPTPTGQDLYGLWGGESGIFTVGNAATILRQNVPVFPRRLSVTQTGQGTVRAVPGQDMVFDGTHPTEFEYGAAITLRFTPASGSSVQDVRVDGDSVGPVSEYAFPSLAADHTVEVDFVRQTSTITSSAGTGGTISPLGAVIVTHGTDQLFTITPDTNYQVNNVLVDGISQGAIYYYTFTNVLADHTISASFVAGTTYTITPTSGTGGSIYPNWPVPVDSGGSQTFTMTPDTGYRVLDVQVNGASQGAITSYTFTGVLADQTISVTFERLVYAIASTSTTGGTISPSGTTAVYHGDDQTYTVTPDTGYHISDLLVDGASVGALSTYTFSNVTQNHTIHAVFVPDNHTITASAGTGGSISPSGAVLVPHNTDQTFIITPATGYDISDVLVDGASVGAVTTYTFSTVSTDHTIAASFTVKTYTLAATAGAGGTISPSGSLQVTHGQSQTYTITPNTGYDIADVLVDGASVGVLYTYTFSNVSADHTIDVTFAIKTYTIIASSSLNGSITPSGNVSVNYQTDQSFTIAADTGYNITQLLVDNVSIGTVPSDPYTYTFTSVTANHTIHAEFGNASTVTAVATVSNSSPTSGTTVTLDGSGSTPSTGLTYSWTQTSGTPTVPFYDASAVSTTFVAPVVNTATQLTFTLTVTDGQNTDSTDVLVTVQPTTLSVAGAPSDAYIITSSEGPSIGIKITDGSGSGLTVLRSYNASNISDSTNRPDSLPYGLFQMSTSLASGQSTLSITFYLPTATTADAGWYRYVTGTGWVNYSSNATFNTDYTQVTITYTDNGSGDSDATTGRITDLSGMSETEPTKVSVNDHSAGGGCFIGSLW